MSDYHPNLDGPAEPHGLAMPTKHLTRRQAWERALRDWTAYANEGQCTDFVSKGLCHYVTRLHDNCIVDRYTRWTMLDDIYSQDPKLNLLTGYFWTPDELGAICRVEAIKRILNGL